MLLFEPAKYLDDRLPSGTVGFDTWKGYLRHCERHRLIPEHDPPDSIKRTMFNYEYFDIMRNKGFKNRKAAYLHAKDIQRKTGMKAEALLKSFKVDYNKNDSVSHVSKDASGSNESKLNHKKTDAVVEKTVDTVEEV